LMDIETAQGMLNWPHSGFHVHDAVWAAADDKEFTVRLARYCARNPIALGRMEYDDQDDAVTYHSDKPTGPTAGSETTDALEFLARLTSHIPNKGQVLQRYYGFYGRARARGVAQGEATLGKPAETHTRGRPARVSSMRRGDAHRGVHNRAQGDRPYPRAPAPHEKFTSTPTRAAEAVEVGRKDRIHLDRPKYDRTISARGPLGCPHAPITVENSARQPCKEAKSDLCSRSTRQYHVSTPTRALSHIHFRSAYFPGVD
jgi:hypothetical protein